ncbi:LysR family transcriptional regulator [Gayadomonas joobiniege]|uniref:LysR family transcriptional regulator n=1 Tax=Gayadomonas joobiniege TaxID=1234606 RepID=UPI00036E1108|nr:LysR family transcriptional regulator [Gayadomonas joobiniege]
MSVQSKTQDLQAFLTVNDSGSFSAAARLLDQPVAKVSRAISRLEDTLKVTLFNRTTRRIELTVEGQEFLTYVRDGLNLLEKGEENLRLLKGTPRGQLRIDAASPFVLHQITPNIKGFMQAYENISLDITSNDSIIDLLEHKTDIAIRIGQLSDSNLNARTLGRSRLHLVASPGYLKNRPIKGNASTLAQHQLIGFSLGSRLNEWPLKQAVKLHFTIRASSGETIRQLCLADQGIALLSNFMVNRDILDGRLISVFSEDIVSPNPREAVQAVYYKNTAVSARIKAFLDYLSPRLSL